MYETAHGTLIRRLLLRKTEQHVYYFVGSPLRRSKTVGVARHLVSCAKPAQQFADAGFAVVRCRVRGPWKPISRSGPLQSSARLADQDNSANSAIGQWSGWSQKTAISVGLALLAEGRTQAMPSLRYTSM